jgi:O-antigen/teichoic acid export membrane protein
MGTEGTEFDVAGQLGNESSNRNQEGKMSGDLAGRDRLVWNVIFNWGGYLVFIVAGFVLPRMMDRRLGQEMLGVWDFSWSLVTYFRLVGGGIASSVNRYVARYRMVGDISGVNRVVSSACCIMAISGLLAVGLTIAASLLLPHVFGSQLGENLREAQWVVFFLGISVAVEIAFGAYNGVLTGCHRWEVQNVIEAGWHAVTIAAMIVVLRMGRGVRILSLIYLVGIILAYATRMIFAYRVCEGLRVSPALVRWATIREQFAFGAKTLIPSISGLLLNQTTSVLLVGYLGPAMLALYSRPRYLLLHVNMLVNKMGLVLIPTTSSLQSRGAVEGIQELSIKAVRYAFYMVLPIVLVLVIYGGAIMQLWMGPRYADGVVPAILAACSLLTMVQTPIWVILVGLNAHGRAGIAEFVASLCSAGMIVVGLGFLKWGLAGVAVAVTVPLMIMNLVYLPFLLCRQVGLHVRQYFLSVLAGPIVHVLPFALCLVVSRLVFKTEPARGLLYGGAAGSIVLAVLYYRYVVPDRIKMLMGRLWRAKGSTA